MKAYYKDAFHDYVVRGDRSAVNPEQTGTKAAAHYVLKVPAHGSTRVRLRLADDSQADPFRRFDSLMAQRQAEADAFYADLQGGIADEDARAVQRQAFAGMIWSKQFYRYDVPKWIKGDLPPSPRRRRATVTAATASGRMSRTPTSFRCRTSGSTPGTPRGTSPSTCCPSP